MTGGGPVTGELRLRAQTWDLLAEALGEIRYTRDEGSGDRFRLVRDDDSNYAVLYVFTHNPNTYRPEEIRHTRHEFVVPVATYNKAAWTRWVFDRIVSIELHETCESFQVVEHDAVQPDDECLDCKHQRTRHDGRNSTCADCEGPDNTYRHRFVWAGPRYVRPYAPHHGNGWDPYTVWYDGHPDEQAKAPGED